MAQSATARGNQTKPGFRAWFALPRVQKWFVIVAFAIVPMLLMMVFTYVPFGKMIEYSLYDRSYTKVRAFVGLKNYVRIFTKKDYFDAMFLSVYYMGGALLQLALALYFATMLSFRTRGGNFFKGTIFFPYLINGIAIGFIFKFFYTRGYVLDTVLQALGIPLESLPYWLRDQRINNISLVATSVWRYRGQNMVMFIGAIMSVDPTLYEAAQIDGANRWKQFLYIILPSIKTIVMLNVILSITGSLSAFEPPYVIMGGGASGTAACFIKMHQAAHIDQKVGMACAMAVVLMVIIIIATILQKLFFRFVLKEGVDYTVPKQKRAAKAGKGA